MLCVCFLCTLCMSGVHTVSMCGVCVVHDWDRVFAACAFGKQALSCIACQVCRRVPLLNNRVVVTTLLPLWFSLSMVFMKMESRARQRQLAAFSLAAAVPAVCVITFNKRLSVCTGAVCTVC